MGYPVHMPDVYRRAVSIPRTPAEVYSWHERSGAFERLMPPWINAEVLRRDDGILDGSRTEIRLRVGPVRIRWEAEHTACIPGVQFKDVQRSGPFAQWEHLHRFESDGAGGCLMIDEITYTLPRGVHWLAARRVRRELDRLFAYRHSITRADLERMPSGVRPAGRRVLVSGASGFIGRALVPYLSTQGFEVIRLVRRPPRGAGEWEWNPLHSGAQWPTGARVDAVVHLAGENLAGGRWSPKRKEAIRRSRIEGTRHLLRALGRLEASPDVFVCASAIGYYGDRGEEPLGEDAGKGEGFLSDVCAEWESEASAAVQRGMRWVSVRTGVVLSPAGGALGKLVPVFKAGLGGRLSHGRQWMSWISMDDLLDVYLSALNDAGCQGPLNAVSPAPCRNADFAAALGDALHRPALLPVPAAALRLGLGELAEATLLASNRVIPAKLAGSGHRYRHPQLEGALRHVLGSPR